MACEFNPRWLSAQEFGFLPSLDCLPLFREGSFVYHDLASARSKSQYMGTCVLRDETGNLKGLRGLSRFNK
jgi:hypothetical protein